MRISMRNENGPLQSKKKKNHYLIFIFHLPPLPKLSSNIMGHVANDCLSDSGVLLLIIFKYVQFSDVFLLESHQHHYANWHASSHLSTSPNLQQNTSIHRLILLHIIMKGCLAYPISVFLYIFPH